MTLFWFKMVIRVVFFYKLKVVQKTDLFSGYNQRIPWFRLSVDTSESYPILNIFLDRKKPYQRWASKKYSFLCCHRETVIQATLTISGFEFAIQRQIRVKNIIWSIVVKHCRSNNACQFFSTFDNTWAWEVKKAIKWMNTLNCVQAVLVIRYLFICDGKSVFLWNMSSILQLSVVF